MGPLQEAGVRLGAFAGVFAAMLGWEMVAAYRARTGGPRRGLANLVLAAVDASVVRLVFPLSLAALAVVAEANGWGLLNRLGTPSWAGLVLGVALLDLAMYLQHVVLHAVPALWRLHMVHHADVFFDITTGLRFHPIEVLLSMVIKMAVVLLLGPPAAAALAFEILLNATALFNHANASLPVAIDRALRWLVVTPDMHRIHHSPEVVETNSNFGFCLPWWDRMLGTYREEAEAGRDNVDAGLSHLPEARGQGLLWLLTLPFRGSSGDYPMGRRRR